MDGMTDFDLREEIMAIYGLPDVLRESWRAIWRGTPLWMVQDWAVETAGYRLVIEYGAIAGLAYDDGIPVILPPGALAGQRVTEPPPGLPYKYFGMAEPSITCPVCGMTSHNPNDVREGFCGNCQDWTGAPR